jgi:hypothetical protein
VLLIPIPYFYYPGMRIELDAIFDRSNRLAFATVDAANVESALAMLEPVLVERGSSLGRLLALRTYFVGDWLELSRARHQPLRTSPTDSSYDAARATDTTFPPNGYKNGYIGN